MFTLNDIMQGNGDQAHIYEQAEQLSPDLIFREAHHDSRQVGENDLFVAIKGEQVDGHDFIKAAVQAGARGVLATRSTSDLPADFVQIIVPDVVQALQATARVRAQRQQETIFIGITGSNGKTSTKDAVASVLSYQAPTLKTLKSYNNELGYPLTLLRLEPEHRYAVLEMGAQWVGELAGLCRTIAAPDWSLITIVGTSHIEYFGSQERIAQAKSEIVQALDEKGVAILNYDDPYVRAMSQKTSARILYYGLAEEAHIRASEIQIARVLERDFLLHYHGQKQHVQLHLPGKHGVTIALAAAAAASAADMPLETVVTALEALKPSPGRGEVKAGPNGSTIIDDSYNASRQSITAITDAMQAAPRQAGARCWAILGDIFELGSFAQEEHQTTGYEVAAHVDYLLAVGDQARYYYQGAIEAGMSEKNAHYFAANVTNNQELEAAKRAAADYLLKHVQPGDLILLKGSRGMRMETLQTML